MDINMRGYICQVCGARLDPGETCDCERMNQIAKKAAAEKAEKLRRSYRKEVARFERIMEESKEQQAAQS